MGSQFITPKDIEDITGLTEGNIFQGELSLEQLFFNRPVPGWARYRTPIRDLWMCGSATHPGGGIMGAPGRIAALEVLKGRKRTIGGRRRDGRARDVVVIGAGHNGLVAAAYLAKDGRTVTVLERADEVGGILRGSEIAPGFTAPGIAHTVGRLRRSVVEDLELARHGLELLTPAVRLFAPQPDGSSVTFWGDVDSDRGGAPRAEPAGRRRVRLLRPEGPSGRVVPRLRQRRDAAGHQRPVVRGRDLRSPGRLGVPRASARSSVARRSARCRWPWPIWSKRCSKRRRSEDRSPPAGCSSRRAARGRRARPRVFLNDSAGNDGGAAGTAVFARGGTQALAAALASAASAAGAEIRTGVEVTGIRSRDRRVLGVTLADGTEIDARSRRLGRGPEEDPRASATPWSSGRR